MFIMNIENSSCYRQKWIESVATLQIWPETTKYEYDGVLNVDSKSPSNWCVSILLLGVIYVFVLINVWQSTSLKGSLKWKW